MYIIIKKYYFETNKGINIILMTKKRDQYYKII